MITILLTIIVVLLAYVALPFIIFTSFLTTGKPDLVAMVRRIADAIQDGDDR